MSAHVDAMTPDPYGFRTPAPVFAEPPIPPQEAPVAPSKLNLDADVKLLLEMAGVLYQVAGMLDGAKRIQMLTRRETHIEFTDSQANYISQALRTLAKRAETWL